jgi:hypothetical protein
MAKYCFITVFLMSLAIGSVFAKDEAKKKEASKKEQIYILGSLEKINLATDFAQ